MSNPGLSDEDCREAVELYAELGVKQACADQLNISRSTFCNRLKAAAKRNIGTPGTNMQGGVPEGFAVKRLSARFGADGSPAGGWVISEQSKQASWEAFESALAAAAETVAGLGQCAPAPINYDDDLLTVIPMGDPHFGLHVWGKECGEDFDLKIAERLTLNAVERLCAMTPATGTALLLNLGDYFHADDATNRTPRSGANLDVDGRFEKIADIGFMAMVRCIDLLRQKHNRVIVRNNKGNHDPHQAKLLTISLRAWFRDDPRVEVECTPSGFYYMRFGKVLIGSTHGDGAKLTELPILMADDVPDDWAKAAFRVWHCGHFHHNQTKEMVGCTVETHRTLAAGDAWHKYQGYRAGRDMKAIIYHREYGEMSRHRCGVEMLEAA